MHWIWGYGRRKNKEVSRLPAWASRFYVMTYGGEGSHSHSLSSVHSTHPMPTCGWDAIQRSKWIRHVWEERVTIWETKAKELNVWLHWLNSMRLIPKDQVSLFAEDSGNPLVKLPLPLRNSKWIQPTLYVLEEQRSFHRSLFSCPSMFWSELYSMLWIKQKLPGKTRAKLGKGDK